MLAISISKCQEAAFLQQLGSPGDVPDESSFHHGEIAQVSLNYYALFEAGVNVEGQQITARRADCGSLPPPPLAAPLLFDSGRL